MATAILSSALSLSPRSPSPALSSMRFFMTNGEQFMVPTRLSIGNLHFKQWNLTIRMGGGPRTFPGGVSKWQWKRMQAKKAKQLLKARLCRERQIYEMRKRAELKAAISELERPWEVVEKAPNLFSVKADEQLKVLADRFQKPGGFDMWSERDGPQILRPYDGLPSERFFPKGVVHSVRPYGVIADAPESSSLDNSSDEDELQFDDWIARGKGGTRRMRRSSVHKGKLLSDDEGIRETNGTTRSNVTKGSPVSRASGLKKHDGTDGGRRLMDHGRTDFVKASNSNLMGLGPPGRVYTDANGSRNMRVSGKNELNDTRRRSTVSSSHGRPKKNHNGRYSCEKSNGSNIFMMTNGRVGRVKAKSNGHENVADHGFIATRHLLQRKNSQGNDAYRRGRFNWSEDI